MPGGRRPGARVSTLTCSSNASAPEPLRALDGGHRRRPARCGNHSESGSPDHTLSVISANGGVRLEVRRDPLHRFPPLRAQRMDRGPGVQDGQRRRHALDDEAGGQSRGPTTGIQRGIRRGPTSRRTAPRAARAMRAATDEKAERDHRVLEGQDQGATTNHRGSSHRRRTRHRSASARPTMASGSRNGSAGDPPGEDGEEGSDGVGAVARDVGEGGQAVARDDDEQPRRDDQSATPTAEAPPRA